MTSHRALTLDRGAGSFLVFLFAAILYRNIIFISAQCYVNNRFFYNKLNAARTFPHFAYSFIPLMLRQHCHRRQARCDVTMFSFLVSCSVSMCGPNGASTFTPRRGGEFISTGSLATAKIWSWRGFTPV
jgi:hypothetical protein